MHASRLVHAVDRLAKLRALIEAELKSDRPASLRLMRLKSMLLRLQQRMARVMADAREHAAQQKLVAAGARVHLRTMTPCGG